ncbi:nitrogen regulation protein NR(II) [Halopenitus salinus]|jgi:PAS domain S-box-containing protein|uniref:histidine kinase n=1 Tax=Halopenitus salinus TaxID=1198295 RepID=A0ABD5URW0_9EURY
MSDPSTSSPRPDIPLADSEGFYQTLVENVSEGLLTIDADSRIVYANPGITRILGYEPEELIGSSKMRIIPERLRETHARALAAYVETGQRNIDWDGVELPALHADGHEVPTMISLREHEIGGERYFTGIIRDVSERRRRESELRRQKEQLDEFAGIVSHDIKNPLGVAKGYTELAREEHDTPELERVAESLDRIEELVDDVLALSRRGVSVGDVEPVAVGSLAEEVWSEIDADGATLSVADDCRPIRADETRFRELLGNLLRNAVEHAGPNVRVRIGPIEGSDGELEGFYVADDGPGIPESEREAVLEHGYTTREHGTGYGLAIVADVAKGHGWTFEITADEEGGARFEFTGVETVPHDAVTSGRQ